MSRGGSFVLVRQYRPVIERWTLEFPGGLRDPGEDPEVTAARELKEETGFRASEIIPLIACDADVGRLCNKFFGFFALADQVADPEPGIGVVVVTGEELKATPQLDTLRCRATWVFSISQLSIRGCESFVRAVAIRLCPG